MDSPTSNANSLRSGCSASSLQGGQTIHWPKAYQPTSASAIAHNEITIPTSAGVIWAWLLRAELWPTWYPNSSDIHFLSHSGPDLRDQSSFRWKTFGLQVMCKVLEFEVPYRLAWEARGIGVAAWHAWLLTPLKDGSTHVLTEEVQHGWLSRLGKIFAPDRMQTQHQLWLEGLRLQAQTGMPPDIQL